MHPLQHRSASLRVLPLLALFTTALTGCPMAADCFPNATVHVTLDSAVDAPPGTPLVIASVSQIYDSDITGTDERGLPVGRAMDQNVGGVGRTVDIVPNERSYTATIGVDPYPTYYFAFVDLDRDGWPDPDEPLGVDPENPIDSGCDEPTRAITIKPAGAR
ncbi:hypothetical protein WMF30_18065 [Sorangium sp. So ce134]